MPATYVVQHVKYISDLFITQLEGNLAVLQKNILRCLASILTW